MDQRWMQLHRAHGTKIMQQGQYIYWTLNSVIDSIIGLEFCANYSAAKFQCFLLQSYGTNLPHTIFLKQ